MKETLMYKNVGNQRPGFVYKIIEIGRKRQPINDKILEQCRYQKQQYIDIYYFFNNIGFVKSLLYVVYNTQFSSTV